MARALARHLARARLTLSVATLNAPTRTDKELIVSPVSFLFSDDHRLSFVGGDQALTNIVLSLFAAAEEHYGRAAVRLFAAFKSAAQKTTTRAESRLRSFCGVPVLFFFITALVALFVTLILLLEWTMAVADDASQHTSGIFAALVAFAIVFVACASVPAYLLVVRMLVNIPQRRIKRLAHRLPALPFERLIQKLQAEVRQFPYNAKRE